MGRVERGGLTICALCLEERRLCDSHVIPEFTHVPGYDEKHRLTHVEVSGRRGYIQKGYRERLLCEDCEGFLNDSYEKPFCRAWYEQDVLSGFPLDEEAVVVSGINYAPFKLFHLSILWRAGIATGGGFEVVDLGPHEEPLRQMVRKGEAGEPDRYPVFGIALTVQNELAHGFVMSPTIWKYEAMRIYSMVYGGFEWGVGVASHCPPAIREWALTRSGRMTIPIRRWADSPFVQQSWKEHLANRDELET